MNSLLRLFREGNPIAVSVLLVVIVAGTYLPVVHNDFVNYDDPSFILSNPHVRTGLTWDNIRWAFTATERGFWHPVTWLSMMLDCQLFGLHAGGHHLVSLLLHVASTLLLFAVFRRMTGATWRSAMVAALFALHPLHVESVAWASERKDVLSTFFLMLTLWAYVRYAERRGQQPGVPSPGSELSQPSTLDPRPSTLVQPSSIFHPPSSFFVLALAFFTLGLMTKTMIVTVPLMMVLLDWWPLGRFESRKQTAEGRSGLGLLWEKSPFLALAFGFGVLTIFAQKGAGALHGLTRLPIMSRADNAAYSYVHYLVQTVCPIHLAMYYPYPPGFTAGAVALAVFLLLVPSVAVLWVARKRPYLAFGWIWYLVTLLPAIGLIQVGNQSHADRYTYVPLVGIFVLLTWGACESAGRSRYRKGILATAASAVLLPCIILTHKQVGYWRNNETLFQHALAVTRDNEVAHNLMGAVLMRKGQLDEAVGHFREAVRLAPNYPLPHGNLGAALLRLGRFDESIAESREAIRCNPSFSGAYRNLGAALGSKGRLDEAITNLQESVRLDPNDPEGHYNLGYGLLMKGRLDDAIAQFQQTLRLRPDHPEATAGLRAALAAKNAPPQTQPTPKKQGNPSAL